VRRGLNETGFVEGRNVTIAYRLAESRLVCLPGGRSRTSTRGCDFRALAGNRNIQDINRVRDGRAVTAIHRYAAQAGGSPGVRILEWF
jgi:hypothetical protein